MLRTVPGSEHKLKKHKLPAVNLVPKNPRTHTSTQMAMVFREITDLASTTSQV